MQEKIQTTELLTIDQPIFSRMQKSADYGVWEVVLVSNEIDRYNTIINPRGFVGTPSTTSIFYNHGGAGTGAVLKNVRVEVNYATGEFVNGNELIIPECCVGEIHVPKEAQLNFRAKDGTVQSAGNLYQAMLSNHSNKVSVGFHPISGKIIENGKETTYNLRSSVMNTEFNQKLKSGFHGEYTQWELPELSVLDVNSGQANSKIKRIRSFENNQNSMSKFKKGDELSRQRKAKIMSDSNEKDGKKFYSVRIDDDEETEIDEDELTRIFGNPKAKEVEKVENEAETPKAKDEQKLPIKKERDGEDLRVTDLENKIESLSQKILEPTSKNSKEIELESENKKEDLESRFSKMETELRLYKQKDAGEDLVQNLTKITDSVNIRKSVDQNESANKPATKPTYEDLLRKYSTTK